MPPRRRHEFLRFCVAGTIGFAVDTAVLYALAPVLGWYGARVLSFWAAVATTWWINRSYTFVPQPGPPPATAAAATSAAATGANPLARPGQRVGPARSALAAEFARYAVSMLGGAAVNYACYAAVMATAPAHRLTPLLGVAVGCIAGMVVNYAAARLVVFRAR